MPESSIVHIRKTPLRRVRFETIEEAQAYPDRLGEPAGHVALLQALVNADHVFSENRDQFLDSTRCCA